MVSPFLLRDGARHGAPASATPAADAGWCGGMIACDRHRRARRRADLALEPRRPAGHARPARRGLPPPAAPVARVLHPHAHRRGPVAHRQRHRRRPDGRHVDRDLDRLQRHHGAPPRSSRWSLLDWRLAVFRLALLPLFVWLTPPRRPRAQADHLQAPGTHGRHVARSSRSRCQRRGILLGKTMGRAAELAERFAAGVERLADLEVRSRMAGRWVMATIQMTFAVMPALVYWFAGQRSPRRRRDLDRHRGRVHHAADAAALPDRPAAAQRRHRRADARWRCSPASSSTSTCRSTSPSAPTPSSSTRACAARSRSRTSASATTPERRRRSSGVDLASRRARRRRSWARPASGKTTLGYLVARLYDADARRG